MACSPLPRPTKKRYLEGYLHVLRLRREALAKLRKKRAGTYRPGKKEGAP
jgi:hypothetical protein